MSGAQKYGLTEVEEHAEQSETAHQIVQEILNFNVSQKQLLMIIKRLALNLENNDHMKKISKMADNCLRDGIMTSATSGASPILTK